MTFSCCRLAAALSLLLFASCIAARHDQSRDGAVVLDLAIDQQAAPDLIAPDLAQVGPLGCKGYVACLAVCAENAACSASCTARVTVDGKAVFDDGVGCGQAYCLDSTIHPPRCVAVGATLADPPGSLPGTCKLCLANALAAYFGATCTPANSPDCNPDGCTFTIAECQASTP
jgi:hypothetical protein